MLSLSEHPFLHLFLLSPVLLYMNITTWAYKIRNETQKPNFAPRSRHLCLNLSHHFIKKKTMKGCYMKPFIFSISLNLLFQIHLFEGLNDFIDLGLLKKKKWQNSENLTLTLLKQKKNWRASINYTKLLPWEAKKKNK